MIRSEHVSYGGPGHILVIGAPRCNKTSGVLIPNMLMLDQRPLIIFNDCRAEIYRIIARWRRTLGPLLLINPFGLGDPENNPEFESDGFNLLADLDPLKLSFYSDALAYGESMIKLQPHLMQPIFNVSAQQIVAIMAMLAKLTYGHRASQATVQSMIALAAMPGEDLGDNEAITAAAVATLVSQGIPEDAANKVIKLFSGMLPKVPGPASALIEKAIQGDYSPDPANNAPCPYPQFDIRRGGKPFRNLQLLASQLKAKAGNDNRFFQDRIATCQIEMGKLNDTQLMEDMTKTPMWDGVPFEFKRVRQHADIKRQRGVFTVVVMMKPRYFVTHAIYTRALVSNCLNSLMEDYHPEQAPLVPLVVIEEMPQLGRIDAILSQINMAAGNGMQYLMVGQQLSKFRDVYGEDGLNTILDACGVKICFCSEDPYTQDILAGQAGEKGEWVDSWTRDNAGAPVRHRHQRSLPLIRPLDIRNLPQGRAITWVKHAPPIYTDVPGYFDEVAWPGLRGKYDVNTTLPMNQRRVVQRRAA